VRFDELTPAPIICVGFPLRNGWSAGGGNHPTPLSPATCFACTPIAGVGCTPDSEAGRQHHDGGAFFFFYFLAGSLLLARATDSESKHVTGISTSTYSESNSGYKHAHTNTDSGTRTGTLAHQQELRGHWHRPPTCSETALATLASGEVCSARRRLPVCALPPYATGRA
jgi:hypothetical protein